jgi:hypothetical protein
MALLWRDMGQERAACLRKHSKIHILYCRSVESLRLRRSVNVNAYLKWSYNWLCWISRSPRMWEYHPISDIKSTDASLTAEIHVYFCDVTCEQSHTTTHIGLTLWSYVILDKVYRQRSHHTPLPPIVHTPTIRATNTNDPSHQHRFHATAAHNDATTPNTLHCNHLTNAPYTRDCSHHTNICSSWQRTLLLTCKSHTDIGQGPTYLKYTLEYLIVRLLADQSGKPTNTPQWRKH